MNEPRWKLRWLACACAAASLTGHAAPAGEISRDALFDDEKAPAPAADQGWHGIAQGELARTYADPPHNSKAHLRVDLARQGQFSTNVKWKIGGRFDYDAVYARSNRYPEDVRRDQRNGFQLRENYLDIASGDWELRLGRQHIVWGEMVGLFFADVVSAKDMREFLLPDFEVLRIPQWALRAEYFKNDWHAEAIYIPTPSFDEMGKPGADFYPLPLPGPAGTVILGEERPKREAGKANYGLRLSTLQSGWDVSAFYYHSLDASASFHRDPVIGPAPVFVYRPRHDPIDQAGGTLAKDLAWTVLKAEAVYTRGRGYNVTTLTQPAGLVRSNTLDTALGLDFTPADDSRLNLQWFQRIYGNYAAAILQDKRESGASVFLSSKLAPRLEGQVLLIRSLNRNDSLFRPRLAWNLQRNWHLIAGADIFHGPPTGLFGRYDKQDRLYSELRYAF